MSTKSYPAYKDSGVDSLGPVPSTWPVLPVSRYVKFQNGADYKHIEVSAGGYPVIGSGGEFRRASEYLHDGESVLFGRKGTIDKPLHVNGRFWTVDTMYYTTLDRSFLLPRFLFYWALRLPFDYYATNTALPSMTQTDLGSARIALPSLSEQGAIADYLDHETSEIDAFVADQEQLIAILNERRAATITQSVTKGLDPNAPMKDSGIEWLQGEPIPEQWSARKLGHVVRMRSGDSITADSIEPDGTYPVFGGGGFRGYTESFTNDGAHVLIGRQGALCGNIKTARGKFFASEHAVVTYPLADVDLTWLAAVLQVMNLGQYSQSAAQPGISVETISQKKMPVPPFAEQIRIGRYLGSELGAIDAAIQDAHHAIDLSKERRSALISAAVTGKIDVRSTQQKAA